VAIYAIRRLIQAAPVVVLASIFVFAILHIVPGDPAVNLVGVDASQQDVQITRHRLGLDHPLLQQYLIWVGNAVRGNLGTSFETDQSVMAGIRQAAGPTVELAILAYLLSLAIGIPFGALAGMRTRSLWDWGLAGFTTVAVGVPHFVLGLALLYVVSFRLGLLPIGGQVSLFSDPLQSLRYLILPALTLGLGHAAILARFVRASVSQVMHQDYIRTARAKGLAERAVIIRHALRNGLTAVITIAALQVAGLLAGVVVIENVFSRPGIGRLIVDAIRARDYPVVQGVLLVLVMLFIVVNLVADLLYGVIDPRIRAG
jgi:peptide/nickel transport system permease protein